MPASIQQPSLVLNYALIMQGIFPSRDQGGGEQGVGHLRIFAFNFLPGGGTADPGGQLLPLSQNTALFSILGTNYGGNGVSNFALPNLDGRAAHSSGQGPGLSDYFLGQESGFDFTTIVSVEVPLADGGGAQPTSTLEETLTINYCISPFGIFPSSGSGGALIGMVGQITAFAGNFAPNGTLFCDGRLLPISEFETLFTVIGTTYGGDGQETFALPDLRGRVPIGTGTGPGLANVQLGQTFGVEELTLTQANLPVAMGGSDQPIGNHGPSLGITYLIALQGTFPNPNGGGLQGGVGDSAVLGEIVMFAGNTPPSGYAIAAGQLLPINQNQALFSLFGTTFGGDGRVNFALPDLRGRAVIDEGAGANFGDRLGTATTILTPGDFDALTLSAGAGIDLLFGANQGDTLFGNAGNDTLNGLGGDDFLVGGAGSNQLRGDVGSDTADFRDAPAGVTASILGGSASINGYGGIDSFNSIENLAGSEQADSLTGDNSANVLSGRGGNDMLFGLGGADTIDGGFGADAMDGGDGSDIFIVDNAGDTVVEAVNQGTDIVRTTITSYTLTANVENLTYTGSAAFTGRGNSLNNVVTGGTNNDNLIGKAGDDMLIGGNGNDVLSGDAGTDTLNGGDGNDTLVVSDTLDTLIGGAGIDTALIVAPGLTVTLGSDVEWGDNQSGGAVTLTMNALDNLYGGGSGIDTVFGGDGNDNIYGRGGNDALNGDGGNDRLFGDGGDDVLGGGIGIDVLEGGADNDTLSGGSGVDTLYGQDGDDVLSGGADFDTLVGGLGADRFAFASGDTGSTLATADRIVDFSTAQGDRIDLSAIDAVTGGGDDGFSFIGSAAFSNVAGQLRAEVFFGNTYVMGDTNGDGIADFVVKIDGNVPLSGSDFIL